MRCGVALPRLASLRDVLGQFEYASCGLVGREDGVAVLRAAHDDAPAPAVLAEIDRLLGLDDEDEITYRDACRHVDKRVIIESGRLVVGGV